MIQLFSILTFFLSIFGNQGDKQLNDPKAKVLLDAVSKTYKGFNSIQADFSLTTSINILVLVSFKESMYS